MSVGKLSRSKTFIRTLKVSNSLARLEKLIYETITEDNQVLLTEQTDLDHALTRIEGSVYGPQLLKTTL